MFTVTALIASLVSYYKHSTTQTFTWHVSSNGPWSSKCLYFKDANQLCVCEILTDYQVIFLHWHSCFILICCDIMICVITLFEENYKLPPPHAIYINITTHIIFGDIFVDIYKKKKIQKLFTSHATPMLQLFKRFKEIEIICGIISLNTQSQDNSQDSLTK